MSKIEKEINICFAIDKNYVDYCGTAIVSILKNSNANFHFFILNSGLEEFDKNKILSLKKIKYFEIEFIEVSMDFYINFYLPPNSHFSKINYVRLFLSSILINLNKVIYLDSDLIVFKDISDLWNVQLENYYVMGSKSITSEENSFRLNLGNNFSYINAGVLVFNLEKIRKNKIEEKFLSLIKKNSFKNCDQDVLNIIFSKEKTGIKYIDCNWNTEIRNDVFKKDYLSIIKNPYIAHFVTGDKPWNKESKQLYKEKFFYYYNLYIKNSIKLSKLIMTLLVKNEVDIIKDNIDFHLSHGVDFIIATDNNSTDGTRDILSEYEKEGKLLLIDEKGDDKSQAKWNNKMARIAIDQYKADAIFHCDADEMWYPISGDLKNEIFNSNNDVLIADIVNICLEDKGGQEKFPDDAVFAVINPIISNNYENETKDKNLFLFKYPSKLIFKTDKGLLEVGQGNHNIENKTDNIIQNQSQDIIILHFPIRGKKNFLDRVLKNGKAVEKNKLLKPGQSFHVLRWYESLKNGTIEEEYNRIVISKEESIKLKEQGIIEDFDYNLFFKNSSNNNNNFNYFIKNLKLSEYIRDNTKNEIKLEKQEKIIKEKEEIIDQKNTKLKTKDEIINQKDVQLNAVLNSTSWKITKPMRIIFDKIKRLISLIKYSFVVLKNEGIFSLIKRTMRFFYKKIKKNFFGMLGLIQKSFFILKNEGLFVLMIKIFSFLKRKYLTTYSYTKKDIFNLNLVKKRKLSSLKVIEFQNETKPVVSIIIPIFNNWKYTYNCLFSLKNNIKNNNYEIIVVDDGSTDETSEMIKKIKNIKYIKNEKNIGFVGSCNFGSKKSIGEYLVFLNNDTYVKEGWLEELLNTFKNNKNIGLVGSKLIYSNGLLQEAGGIIWSDGDGFNYGRMQNPNDPEFNYLKDVDYCSGASIMIPRNTFNKINGFDEIFSPGYYEDTDLAFKVRSIGLRTVYQPLSEVFHFEGITSGTDLTSGMKKFQVENSKKFFEKWKEVLKKDHMNNKIDNLFTARDRVGNKKILLFIDNNIPTYDQDAGSYIAFQYLKILNDLNYKIIFWPHNLLAVNPYLKTLQQMGIEVFYGNKNFDSFLKDNGKFIDIVFVSRPHVAKLYLDKIKNYSNAKIVYIAHDLHFLRESREDDILGLKKNIDHIQEMKNLEFEIFSKSDISLFFSEIEVDYIKNNISKSVSVGVIPWIQEVENSSPFKFNEREGLLFMGGYNHKPNVDAAVWFNKEILPKVLNKISGMKSFFYGSNSPEELRSIKSDYFLLKGFLNESDVKDVFSHAKIFIAPLRYGAGFKGKIAKAMSNGIPVVTTEIGAEGIGIIHGVNGLVSSNDSNKFSDNIVNLYTDKDLWQKISNESIKHVERNFSVDNAKTKLSNIINNL